MLALAVVCWCAAPTAAGAASFGVNMQTLINWDSIWAPNLTASSWDPYLQAAKRDGLDVIRMDAAWDQVQPTPAHDLSSPANWALADRFVTAFAQQGLRWAPVVDVAPPWAREPLRVIPGCTPAPERYLPPRSAAEFAAFAGALARRYGAGGTFWAAHPELPALPIQQYEIWNEPNIDLYWNSRPNAAAYAELFDASRDAIRAHDPAARVLIGGLAWGGPIDCGPAKTNDDTFLAELFAIGGPGWDVDGVATHPYGPSAINMVANLRRLSRALVRAGRAELPLEITEFGWPTRPPGAPAGSMASTWFGDASHAGAIALSADAVRGSDCRTDQMVVYTSVERELTLVGDSPLGPDVYDLIEQWMGVYAAGASANAPAPHTQRSAAWAAAVGRDRAGENAGPRVGLCGTPGSGRTLPLTLDVAPEATAGCWTATVTYRGHPVRDAELLRTAPIVGSSRSHVAATFSDEHGRVPFCAAQGGPLAVRAVVGGGFFDPAVVPEVATSPEVALSAPAEPPSPPVPPAGPRAQTPPCALRSFAVPAQRLSTVRRTRIVRVRLGLSSLGGGARRCDARLLVEVPAKKRGAKAVRVASRTAIVGTTSDQTLRIRLSRTGAERLRRVRDVRATVRLELPQALTGTQARTLSARLRR